MNLRSDCLKGETVLKLVAVCLGVVDSLVMNSEKKAVFDAFVESIRPVMDEYEVRRDRVIDRIQPSNN